MSLPSPAPFSLGEVSSKSLPASVPLSAQPSSGVRDEMKAGGGELEGGLPQWPWGGCGESWGEHVRFVRRDLRGNGPVGGDWGEEEELLPPAC